MSSAFVFSSRLFLCGWHDPGGSGSSRGPCMASSSSSANLCVCVVPFSVTTRLFLKLARYCDYYNYYYDDYYDYYHSCCSNAVLITCLCLLCVQDCMPIVYCVCTCSCYWALSSHAVMSLSVSSASVHLLPFQWSAPVMYWCVSSCVSLLSFSHCCCVSLYIHMFDIGLPNFNFVWQLL